MREADQETDAIFADIEKQIDEAVQAFQAALEDDRRIPAKVVAHAEAVAIFPALTKAGVLVGGRFGEGVVMLRQQGEWRGPLFVDLYGASVGLQLGVEQADVFLFFISDPSLESFQDGELTIGAEGSVAAGTWGGRRASPLMPTLWPISAPKDSLPGSPCLAA